jgi:hypothetical protein
LQVLYTNTMLDVLIYYYFVLNILYNFKLLYELKTFSISIHLYPRYKPTKCGEQRVSLHLYAGNTITNIQIYILKREGPINNILKIQSLPYRKHTFYLLQRPIG